MLDKPLFRLVLLSACFFLSARAEQCPNTIVKQADDIASFAFCLEADTSQCNSATPVSDAMMTSEDANVDGHELTFEDVCQSFEDKIRQTGGEEAIENVGKIHAFVTEQRRRRRLREEAESQRRLQVAVNPDAMCPDPAATPCDICPVPSNETLYVPFPPCYPPTGGSYEDAVQTIKGTFIIGSPFNEIRTDAAAVGASIITLATTRALQAVFALCDFIPRTLPIPIPFIGLIRIPNPIYLICKAPELALIVLVRAFEILQEQ
eukprot:Cvel_34265.t1-p1 / transcript=Cvel_34265.t1 / gene=Cvel_34265 / organism=Chromera_velia_CCMP2878 / gene_product=hypothetical protein / transcript_product=hypothetical protein / location=Cvel_scaffold5815:3186-3971(+) / protein_length=262 / sequence_SO=supercontig / SO=protein_coding / is_pseudo=false